MNKEDGLVPVEIRNVTLKAWVRPNGALQPKIADALNLVREIKKEFASPLIEALEVMLSNEIGKIEILGMEESLVNKEEVKREKTELGAYRVKFHSFSGKCLDELDPNQLMHAMNNEQFMTVEDKDAIYYYLQHINWLAPIQPPKNNYSDLDTGIPF